MVWLFCPVGALIIIGTLAEGTAAGAAAYAGADCAGLDLGGGLAVCGGQSAGFGIRQVRAGEEDIGNITVSGAGAEGITVAVQNGKAAAGSQQTAGCAAHKEGTTATMGNFLPLGLLGIF